MPLAEPSCFQADQWPTLSVLPRAALLKRTVGPAQREGDQFPRALCIILPVMIPRLHLGPVWAIPGSPHAHKPQATKQARRQNQQEVEANLKKAE